MRFLDEEQCKDNRDYMNINLLATNEQNVHNLL